MKKPSDDIFKLVKSLDSHEKAFIKRCFHKESGASINEDLFDYLNSQSEYDENKMILAVKKISKITVKHCKQTLLDYLFKTLELYYADATTEQKLYSLLFQIRILRKKKLFSKANKLIKTAIEKASKEGYFLFQLQFMAEQQFLALDSDNYKGYEEIRTMNLFTQKSLLESYSRVQQNQEMIYVLRRLNVTDGCYPEKEKKQIIKKINSKIVSTKLELEEKPSFIVLQEKFIEYYSYLMINEYYKAKSSFEIYLSLYEKFNDTFINSEDYLWHINIGITISVFTHDKDLLWVLDKKAENVVNSMLIKARSISVMTNYFTVKNNVIAFLTHIEEFVEASIKSEDLQSEILTESVKPSIRKIFLANLCQIYLCIGKIKKALHCYNSIKNNKEFDDIRTDIDPGLNVLGLAIFYEINSLDNIECLIRSYKRKSDFMFQNKIYIAIINFFSDICKETEDKKIKLLFEEIIIKVNNIDKKDSKSIFFLENTLISAWLRKKIDEFK